MKQEFILLICILIILGLILSFKVEGYYWDPLNNSAFNMEPQFWNYKSIN